MSSMFSNSDRNSSSNAAAYTPGSVLAKRDHLLIVVTVCGGALEAP